LGASVVEISYGLESGVSVDFTKEHLVGRIEVWGDVSGDILNVDDVNSNGKVWVLGSLTATGRILIDGLCGGKIGTDEETVGLSQIHIKEGLDDDGTITINYDGGDLDANGTIYIGESTGPLGNVTFDGSILIQNGSNSHCHGGD
jgi:hypothetical protein